MAHGRELAAAFSDEAFEAIWFAADPARPITTGDLLCGIASLPNARAARVLGSLGLHPSVLRAAIEHARAEPLPDPAEPYRGDAERGSRARARGAGRAGERQAELRRRGPTSG